MDYITHKKKNLKADWQGAKPPKQLNHQRLPIVEDLVEVIITTENLVSKVQEDSNLC